MNLFLDDIREINDVYVVKPEQKWKCVRSYKQFIKYIKEYGVPEFLSLDHDLGQGKNGCDCAKWLIDNGYKIKKFNVHSSNPVGKKNIMDVLTDRNK